MADLYREVEEEVRRDQAAALFKKYRNYIIALVAVLILGALGFHGWRYYDEQQRGVHSVAFAKALDLAGVGETENALAALALLPEPGDGGYGLLAAFEKAKLLAASGDRDGAVVVWGGIAAESDAPEAFRGLATLLAVLHQIDDGDRAALQIELDPLTSGGQPYRPTALELLALLALRDGDRAAAHGYYSQLADEAATPAAQSARARQMLDALTDDAAE